MKVERVERTETARGPILVSVKNCARCGGHHEGLKFDWLERPMAPADAPGVVWSYWAMCPAIGQPIMLRSEDAKDQ